jgi:EAL domain-containing protein (putative c-di-GMP-specific phosphodiesterase class I)
VAESNEPATAESLGWQLRSALPPMRLSSVSIYNAEADCLWLSEGALGPDEHNVVVEAIEGQKAEKAQQYFEYGMEDGRIAVFLPIRGPRGELSGTVMILADMKSMTDGMMEKIVTPQVRTVLVKIAMFMRRSAPASSTAEVSQEIQMPGEASTPSEVNLTSTTVIEKLPSATVASLAKEAAKTLGPREVEQILELELVVEPPRPGPAPAPVAAGKAAPAAAAKNARQASTQSAPAASNSKTMPAASKANSKAAPTVASATAAPVRGEVEVLQFDADFSIPVAKPAAAPAALPDGDVLAFEPDFAVPPAKSSIAPNGATAANVPPAATNSTSTTNRALSSSPASKPGAVTALTAAAPPVLAPAPPVVAPTPIAVAPAVSPAPAPAQAEAPVSRAARTGTAPTLAPAPAAKAPAPAAKPAPVASVSSTQTTAVPVIRSDDDDDVGLIQDTGKHPSLDTTTTIEPAPQLPPLEPLSVEESATDLTLFAQELIKLRSSGRTRRYEVLARSQRDANRNEVPAAFVAETARGKDGAALDSLVLERLLTWLGKHGEAIWDSEPASFSVNVSIGAIEDQSFLPRIQEWMEKHSVPAEYIGFEITEFACVQCKPAVQRFIDEVEKMGCFLVIDNFSFDSSVFEFLGSKALRHVKLDPKLTDAAMKDKLPQALVVAILQACKVLGVHCVAKRVESKSSMQWLTAVGCDFAQAFSLHKPLPLESLASGQPIKALRE